MIKALFWCFAVLAAQLGLLHWVDRRVLGMQFGEEDNDNVGGRVPRATGAYRRPGDVA